MAVALVVNGIPDLQPSMAGGLDSLRVLLMDRERSGCIISPTEEANLAYSTGFNTPPAVSK